jgi:DNA polymerase-3 subunit delta'
MDWVAARAEAEPDVADIWLKMARLTGEAETLNTENVQLTARLIAYAGEAASTGLQKAR